MTRISATIKPTLNDRHSLLELLKSGASIIRIPFWPEAEHQIVDNINIIKTFNLKNNAGVDILIDLPGNKVRFGDFIGHICYFDPYEEYSLFEGSSTSDAVKLPVDYAGFVSMCSVGDELICGDGEAVLEVTSKKRNSIKVKTQYKSSISSRKGISIKDKDSHLLGMNQSFIDYCINFCIRNIVNWIALSFTSSSEQIQYIKRKLGNTEDSIIKVMAKIESRDGVLNIDDIIKVSDGIMIARGDLVANIDFSIMGLIQKSIIDKCIRMKKFCMLSTGIMNSILHKSRPTPAEISDLTNAVFHGIDSIQFCEETALNSNPGYVVELTNRIIKNSELLLNKDFNVEESIKMILNN